MSDLSELIEVTRNIEKQNEEIIRLLKKIAGEDDGDDKLAQYESIMDFGELYLSTDKAEENPTVKTPQINNTLKIGTLLENEIGVGEVYFIEGENIFKLTANNNEITINNLTGDSEPDDYSLQEMIANESIKNNLSLDDNTCIISKQQSSNLPETLKVCVEQGCEKIYLPLSASAQLISAPQILMDMILFDFYKNDDDLVEKLFG